MKNKNLFQHIENGAHAGAYGENPLPTPTEAQARAGNYKMGRVSLHGLQIAIEQPRGSYRTGTDPKTGVEWRSRLAAHYGYISGTKAADGDALDAFIGFDPHSPHVFVINQNHPDSGQFDEHKVMLAFPDADAAERAYLLSYERGWRGLGSLIALSVDQFKRWIQTGNLKKPLTHSQITTLGLDAMLTKTYWTADATPENQTLDRLIYDIRRSDAGENLMLDAVTLAEIVEDSDGIVAFDALVTPFARLEHHMTQAKRLMERAGKDVKPLSVQISEPFKQNGVANVVALFELSDGQTVSIYFHNPDVTPGKMAPADEVISWKWLLNKKDITIVVAPEKGEDLNVREVVRRIMKLAEKNSAAFARANAKRADRMQNIQNLKDEITGLEKELDGAMRELEVAKMEAEDRAINAAKDAEMAAVKGPFTAYNVDSGAGRYTVYVTTMGEDAPADAGEVVRSEFGGRSARIIGERRIVETLPPGSWESKDAKGWAYFAKGHLPVEEATPEPTPKAGGTIESVIADVKTRFTEMEDRGLATAQDGWYVMNAARPLMGDVIEDTGEFLSGRHYAGIDPNSANGSPVKWAENNKSMDASMVLYASFDEQAVMSLKGARYKDKLLNLVASGDERATEMIRANIDKIHNKPYTEALAMLEEARAELGGMTLVDYARKVTGVATATGAAQATDAELAMINDALSNDQESTDDEIVQGWKENGISDQIAQAAIAFRGQFLTNPRAYLVVNAAGALELRGNGEAAPDDTQAGLSDEVKRLLEEMNKHLSEAEARGVEVISKEQFMEDVNNGNRLGHSLASLKDRLEEHKNTLAGVMAGTVTPRSVVGKGGKKSEALAWLNAVIAETEAAIKGAGFLHSTNIRNYNHYLRKMLRDGIDDSFESDAEREQKRIEAEKYSAEQEAQRALMREKGEKSRSYEVGSLESMRSPLSVNFTVSDNKNDFRIVAELADIPTPQGKYQHLMDRSTGAWSNIVKMKTMQFRDQVDLNMAIKKGIEFGYFKIEPRVGYSVVTLAIDLQGEVGAKTPDSEGTADPAKVAAVDAAYAFADASDEFKAWLSESVGKEAYSPFVTAKAMDQAAKENGATISWAFSNGAALDSVALDGVYNVFGEGDEVVDKNTGDDYTVLYQKGYKVFVSATKWIASNSLRHASGKKAVTIMLPATMLDSAVMDSSDGASWVGVIRKNGEVVGRVDIGVDGKAMVYVGKAGGERVKYQSDVDGQLVEARYSDDDAPHMVHWLFAMQAAPAKPSATVPPRVADKVKRALKWLQDTANLIEHAKKTEEIAGSEGRYQADVFVERQGYIHDAKADLASFREMAPKNGIDPEAYIQSLGGEPNVTPSREAQEWLDGRSDWKKEAPTRSGTEEQQAIADAAMQMARGVVESLGGEYRADGHSRPGTSGAWTYANATVNGVDVRLGASHGGVVQVNGQPFGPDGSAILTAEQVRAAILAVAPAPVPEPEPAPAPKQKDNPKRKKVLAGQMVIMSNKELENWKADGIPDGVVWVENPARLSASEAWMVGLDTNPTIAALRDSDTPAPADANQEDPQRAADVAMLQSIIDGTVTASDGKGIRSVEVANAIEQIYGRAESDAGLMELFMKALDAYQAAIVAAAQKVMTNAA